MQEYVANANDSGNRSSKRRDMPKNGQEILEGQAKYEGVVSCRCGKEVANTTRKGLEGLRAQLESIQEQKAGRPTGCSDEEDRSNWWIVESNVGRVAHGVPGRVDRLKQLGNSVVPQIPELLGRAILEVS